MKSVKVKAINVRQGDVIDGERVRSVIHYCARPLKNSFDKDELTGVAIITPNPNGYAIKVRDMRGNKRIVVKRPKYNMKRR